MKAMKVMKVLASCGQARLGRMMTRRGEVPTPAFMPIATRGMVRGLSPRQVRNTGARLLLANCFHLLLRPGAEHLRRYGGLHRFAGWQGPILTDSGGYQVFSLETKRSIDPGGVTFVSPIDGSKVRLTPASVMAAQSAIDSDIRMVLDWCPALPADAATLERSVRHSLDWAKISRDQPCGSAAVFGIVQGGLDLALRRQCLDELVAMDFDGYAIGGLSVGETQPQMLAVLDALAQALPPGAPRYLMGVGTPCDILEAVARGVDLFDCVIPTRHGRNGGAFTEAGRLNLRNAAHRSDPAPLEPDCPCPCCRQHSRAFLHHCFRVGDMLGPVLVSQHNLWFYQRLMQRVRDAIAAGELEALRQRMRAAYPPESAKQPPPVLSSKPQQRRKDPGP